MLAQYDEPVAGVRTHPLIMSSTASISVAVAAVEQRQVNTSSAADQATSSANSNSKDVARSHTLAAAIEGALPGETSLPFRAIVIGDGDFASNSFFPFMSNSDLAMSMVRW